MKKKIKVIMTTALCFVLCACFVLGASAKTINNGEYCVFGGKLIGVTGTDHTLSDVTCYNHVSSTEHNDVYRAVNQAIADWDWHLDVLNSQVGTTYNLHAGGAIDMQFAEIAFYAIDDYCRDVNNNADKSVLALTNFYNIDGLGTENQTYTNISENVIYNNANWENSTIFIFLDALSYNGINYEKTRATINHEIGHALGLMHDPSDTGVIMYGSNVDDRPGFIYSFDRWTATVPTLHDLYAVHYLYSNGVA